MSNTENGVDGVVDNRFDNLFGEDSIFGQMLEEELITKVSLREMIYQSIAQHQLVYELLMDKGIATREELDERFSEEKLNHVVSLIKKLENNIKEEQYKKMEKESGEDED